jgi:PleD family two-component response regulator
MNCPVTEISWAAVTVATKMCTSLKSDVEAVWPVTFSIGMVTYRTPPVNTNEMIRTVDQLMYEVKNSGKNELRPLIVPME